MDLFVTIFKFAGIIVSGALGILGTITETRNKRTGQLTPWGKWALGLTITGSVVALGAQIFESGHQMREIQRANSTFKSISYTVCFEVPTNGHPSLHNIAEEMLRIAHRNLDHQSNQLVMPLSNTTNKHVVRICAGFSAIADESRQIGRLVVAINDSAFTNREPQLSAVLDKITESLILHRLTIPIVSITKPGAVSSEYEIIHGSGIPPTKGNLVAGPESQFGGFLSYDITSRCLTFIFFCHSSSDNWRGDKSIISIRDLDNAVCQIWVNDTTTLWRVPKPTDNILADVKLTYARMGFDDLRCSFSSVKPDILEMSRKGFKCVFPSYSRIRSGRANNEKEPLEVDAFFF